jgi:hypothetical protein
MGMHGNMAVVQNMSGIIASEVGKNLGAAMRGPQAMATEAGDDAKAYTHDQLATLLGFHGAMNVQYLQKIWRLFKSAKTPNYDHLRRPIKAEMLRWADNHRCWMEEGVYFDNKMLDKWINLKFNPGDSTAIYSSADKGISILKCQSPTSGHLEELRRQEEIWDATKGNATFIEMTKQLKKEVSTPASDFGELRSNIATFCTLLFTLFGEGCDLYKSMGEILQILSHQFSMQNKSAYTPEVCRRITWAIIVDSRSFFDDIKLAEDFMEAGQHMQFPVSTLILVSNILTASSKRLTDLPKFEKFPGGACWLNAIGLCPDGPECLFANGHLEAGDMTDAIADEVVTILHPGVTALVDHTGPPSPRGNANGADGEGGPKPRSCDWLGQSHCRGIGGARLYPHQWKTMDVMRTRSMEWS